MSKNMTDENFPVAKLVSKKLRPVVIAYYRAARFADDIADSTELEVKEKLAQLGIIEQEFYAGLNKKESLSKAPLAFDLGKIFVQENLDASLYADLLRAFEKDAKETKIEVWEQLIDYCRYSAAPVGRFILALYDESPSAYLQAETLCAVLQISNHLQDLRKDMLTLKRCYLPTQMMQEFDVRTTDIYLDKSSIALRALVKEVNKRLKKMLADSSVLPALIRSKRLKMQIGVILSLTNSMLKKIDRCDVLTTTVCLSAWDWFKALTFGALRGLFRRVRRTGKIL